MGAADPYVLVDCGITIVANPSGTVPVATDIELKCHSNKVSLTPEDNWADADTQCNPDGQIPGSTNWSAGADILLSYGDPAGAEQGSWNLLHPLRKSKQTFKITPNESQPVGPANPIAYFQAWIPTVNFMDNTRGETNRFSLEVDVIGEPAFITEALVAWAATTAYVLDDYVTVMGGVLQATVAGTSGASEPTVPTVVGGTVVDGTVTWVRIA